MDKSLEIQKLLRLKSIATHNKLKAIDRAVLSSIICSPRSTKQLIVILPQDSQTSVRAAVNRLRKAGYIELRNTGAKNNSTDKNKWNYVER